MLKILLNKSVLQFAVFLIMTTSWIATSSYSIPSAKKGTLKISFSNTANDKAITLRDSFYINAFGEQYNITKLKYYVSNLNLEGDHSWKNPDGYFLMNAAAADNSIEISVPTGNYKTLQFLLGVDSLRNCSGAQTGALDPLNDMFWTWNSGYVMFKLEGTSTASTSDLQRIEHHIGGYKGENNVATKINFNFKNDEPLNIREDQTTEILIETNLDHYWNGNSTVKIADAAVCMTTGGLAKKSLLIFLHCSL